MLERYKSRQEGKINFEIIKFKKGALAEGSLKVIEAQPERKVSENPVVIAPGWGNTALSMQKSLETFAKNGRHALAFDHERKQKMSSISEDAIESDETLQRALEILAVLEQQGIDKPVKAIGYSEGGIDLVVAARIAPAGTFQSITLVAPGGMVGEDGSLKLAGRFSLGAIKDALGQVTKRETIMPVMRYTKELMKYLFKNPIKSIPMAVREVKSIANSDITEILKELKEKGIGISLICGVDDKAFPMERVQAQANKDMFDGFYSVKGGHGELILHPEKYTQLVEEALQALDRKLAKEIADSEIEQ